MRARDLTDAIPRARETAPWSSPSVRQILEAALPHIGPLDRVLLRAVALIASRNISGIYGFEHVQAASDPFILVANHSTRRKSLYVPALLFLRRGGRRIHFLADWNFRLIPGVGHIYQRAEVITVTRKPAKPRFLNILKPLYEQPLPALERAREQLERGRSIGMFPEGKVNHDRNALLRGRRGAARLSLETGAPIVPVGIRFTDKDRTRRIPLNARMELHIGPALHPPVPTEPRASVAAVSAWHCVLMKELARLSGKSWMGINRETRL